jgi:hypothetical protein
LTFIATDFLSLIELNLIEPFTQHQAKRVAPDRHQFQSFRYG